MIAVICPTRDRPEKLLRMTDSVCATSIEADVLAYVDHDQEFLYREAFPGASVSRITGGLSGCRELVKDEPSHLHIVVGGRLGPVGSANALSEWFRNDYDIFGMVVDYVEFQTPGWDEYLTEKLSGPAPRLVSAAHSNGFHLDFPFVNRAWIETVGWFLQPTTRHWGWNVPLEVVGDCVGMVWAPEEKFFIQHNSVMTDNLLELPDEAVRFLNWCAVDRAFIVHRLRQKIREVS